MLQIKNLHTIADEKEILKGIDLEVNAGEIHAIVVRRFFCIGAICSILAS